MAERTATTYARVDRASLTHEHVASDAAPAGAVRAAAVRIRWWVVLLAIVLSVVQCMLWSLASNIARTELAGTLIPVLGFAVLMAGVLVVNPLIHGVARVTGWRVSRFSRAELMAVFAAMLVTAGISTFGLVEALVPMIATPYDMAWNSPQRGWDRAVIPHLNPHLYITDPQIIAEYREGFMPNNYNPRTWTDSLRFNLGVLTQIPWSHWLGPLAWWLIFVAGCYTIFYSLTYVVLPFWSRREKLIFPLAKLPEALLPESDDTRRVVPAIFSNPGFWFGMAVALSVLSWNALVQAKWLGGELAPIQMGMGSWHLNTVVQGTMFAGLGSSTALLILFTATGIAFLLPLEMSFSIWFYYAVGQAMMLAAVWMGYGANASDFPTDFLWLTNLITAQGGGAMFAFSAISLGRCLLEWRRLALGRDAGAQVRVAMPVLGLFGGVAVVTAWLAWNGLHPLWALVFVGVLTLLTLGLMRLVAEGGLYWFQPYTGFFHIFRMFGLGHVLPAVSVAPILPIYSVLFLDLKAFIAPSILNAAKLRDDVGGNRVRFHVSVIGSIVATVVVSIAFEIFLAYRNGANQMHWWFYGKMTPWVFDTARDLASATPTFLPVSVAWFTLGGVWVCLSMYLRQSLFWFPHPIGYIMLVNPLMHQLWLSFFIAWAVKKLVVRYGGKMTFEKVRDVAIGMILGEIMAVLLWAMLMLLTGVTVYVTLNRYAP